MKEFTRKFVWNDTYTLDIVVTFLDRRELGGDPGLTSCHEVIYNHPAYGRLQCAEHECCGKTVKLHDHDHDDVTTLELVHYLPKAERLWREISAFEDGLWQMFEGNEALRIEMMHRGVRCSS